MTDVRHRSLSVIIPNYNGAKLFPLFIPSVLTALENFAGTYELIFVDDCSTDESLETIKPYAAGRDWFHTLKTESNGGFSRTCNVGIENAQHEVLFFLNTDVALTENYFSFFSGNFEDANLFAITTCGYKYQTNDQIDGIKKADWRRGMLRVTGNYFNSQIEASELRKPYLSFSIQGAHFFADAHKVRALGGFDELFSPFIFEETDLAYRALKRGWKIIYEPRCVSYHQVGASLRKAAKAFRYNSISTRNRLIFIWKNIHSPRLLFYHLLWQALRLATLNPVQWNALFMALGRLPKVLAQRRIEKTDAVHSDSELLKRFEEYFSTLNM